MRQYSSNLDSLVDECPQCHHRSVDFRAARPPDPDFLLGQEDDEDAIEDDDEQGSDDENDPAVMALCIPPLVLRCVEGVEASALFCYPRVLKQCMSL